MTMTPKPWRALLGTTMATLLLTVTACAGSGDTGAEKEDDMTPDEALGQLREAATQLLTAAAPGNEIDEISERPVPCGGPGGNERNKVRLPYTAGAGLVDDPEAALDAAETKLESLGLRNEGRQLKLAGPSLMFGGEGFLGEVLVRESGAIQVLAETDCLDDPDR